MNISIVSILKDWIHNRASSFCIFPARQSSALIVNVTASISIFYNDLSKISDLSDPPRYNYFSKDKLSTIILQNS